MLTLEKVVIQQDDFSLAADWSADQGGRVALIGPSGAGKSTLLSAIAGFITPQSGRVLWNGSDLREIPPGDRPLSILFQDQNLFPHLTVFQNLGLGLNPSLRLSGTDQTRIATVLDRIGLTGFENRKPGQLSGGQMARVALGRALLRARPILLLDEPFSALGPALKAEMLTLVAEVADETGATVLMVTHEPDDALRFSEKTVLVSDGVAHAPQSTQALFDDPPEVLRKYLGK